MREIANPLPGDVLVCYCKETNQEDVEARGYSHVAICLSPESVLEAGACVQITNVDKLLEMYDHIAVLRDRVLWTASRIAELERFAKIHEGKPFNKIGMRRLPQRKAALAIKVMQELDAHFEGKTKPRNMDSFFCSQLVAECLIHVGIIGDVTAVALSPATTSPKTISDDRVYGQFVGYLPLRDGYTVPSNDRFSVMWPSAS